MSEYCGSAVCLVRVRAFADNNTRVPPPCKQCLSTLRAEVDREAKRRWIR